MKFDILNHDVKELGETLCKFLMEARKSNGDKYPRETVYDLLMCIQMHFHMHGANFKFLEDSRFINVKKNTGQCYEISQ